MSFGPKHTSFQDILVNSLGSLIAGIIGSLVIFMITYALGSYLDITGTFAKAQIGIKAGSIFPLILSIITLTATTLVAYLTYRLLHLTSEEKYKKNVIIGGQIAFFSFITYLFVTPVYIYAGMLNYDYIMYVFLAHTIIIIFGTSLILEIMNNYRHILIGVYGSFAGLNVSLILTTIIFTSFDEGSAKLISLIILLPIINFSVTFFKQVFELAYFYYYKMTNQDQIGDIFYQIEMEEREILRDEEEKNIIS